MTEPARLPISPKLTYSEDGYIRLTYQHFCLLPFRRRMIFNDDELREELLAINLPVSEAGYCEWLDDNARVQVSVGWAWFVSACDRRQRLAPGGISCNVMIMSADGHDLGAIRTHQLLTDWLSIRVWQDERHFAPTTPRFTSSATVH